MFVNIVRRIARVLGYEIYCLGTLEQAGRRSADGSEMLDSLHRLREVGVDPDAIFDVGAAVGGWTRTAMKVWGTADYLLVEPLSEQLDDMLEVSELRNVNVLQAVAGDQTGTAQLTVTADLFGSGVYGKASSESREVPQCRLDAQEIAKRKRSILLKLDTHGYERQILTGCDGILPSITAMVIEVYGFRISPTAPLFHELSSCLSDLGFRLFDIVDVMRRPGDSAFWQADAIYLRSDHSIFLDDSYS